MTRGFRYLSRFLTLMVVMATIYLAGVIFWAALNDYRPEAVLKIEVSGNGKPNMPQGRVFTFLSWNIGYLGLGAEMDFFFDGGEGIHPESRRVKKYTSGVLNTLKASDSIDFILLQEVDRNSTRTDYQDQAVSIQRQLPGYFSTFGYNYKVDFIPVPLLHPLGKMAMGQMTLSRFSPEDSRRYSYFSEYKWPMRLFMLDRCFLVSRYPLEDGAELVVFNTHNSAYDAGGKLREKEMPIIRNLMLEAYKKGNYVVAGGDWNQNPPGYDSVSIDAPFPAVHREVLDASLFPPAWKIVFDPVRPTNREIDAPLTKGKTGVTIIDYFIVSPNVQVLEMKTWRQNFKYSDHEPVFFQVRLR